MICLLFSRLGEYSGLNYQIFFLRVRFIRILEYIYIYIYIYIHSKPY